MFATRSGPFRRPCRAAAFAMAAAAVTATVAPAPAAAAELAAHRALYDMRLAWSKTRAGGVVGARGAMLYAFAEACDAWTVETKVFLRLDYDRGDEAETVETTWTFASSESKDGDRYRFRVRHNRNGRPLETFAGHARLDGAGGGEAVFEDPEERRVALPAGALFPTRHLVRLLEGAAAGERRLGRVVFDGASLENPYEVSAVSASRAREAGDAGRARDAVLSGRALEAEGDTAAPGGRITPGLMRRRSARGLEVARAAGLGETPAWWFRLAFFPLGVGPNTVVGGDGPPAAWRAGLPEFEIEVDYRADGVAERILQDFGDFVLTLTPTKIERLPPPEC